jgi:hypothetical protein
MIFKFFTILAKFEFAIYRLIIDHLLTILYLLFKIDFLTKCIRKEYFYF